MEADLKSALDTLGMTQKEAHDAMKKAHTDFITAHEANLAKRDVLTDEKLAKINAELEKFEPLNKAITEAAAREAAGKTQFESFQAQLDRIEMRQQRPGAVAPVDSADVTRHAAFLDWARFGAERKDKVPQERLNVLTISDDTGGGYLAVPDYVLAIIKAQVEFSPMRPLVTVRQTSSKSVQLPRRTGTFTATWVGETQTRQETQGLSYGMDECPVHELTAEVYITMADLEDSAFDLAAQLQMEFAEQFGVAEGVAIIGGTGTKMPEGILTASGTVSYSSSSDSGSSSAVNGDNLIALGHSIKTAYAQRGTYALNRSSLAAVRKLKALAGTGDYLWMPGIAAGMPNTIAGAPYVEAPDMPNIGAGNKSIMFGDFQRAYTLVDRLALAVIRDGLTRASQGQVKFVARRRLGGQVVLAEAIAVLVGA